MTKNLIIVIFTILLLQGCRQAGEPNNDEMDKKLAYLALGDSYTIGEGVEAGKRWPVQLSESLMQKGIPSYPPLIIAETGWTTDELMDAIQEAHVSPPFDLVSLLIGVNNQYRGRDKEEFRVQFNELLDVAAAFADGNRERVFVLSIPDWSVTPFAEGRDRAKIAAEIEAFNLVIEEETAKNDILFIDITEISKLAEGDGTLLTGDSLHPSGKMYGLWVDKVLPMLMPGLKKQTE